MGKNSDIILKLSENWRFTFARESLRRASPEIFGEFISKKLLSEK